MEDFNFALFMMVASLFGLLYLVTGFMYGFGASLVVVVLVALLCVSIWTYTCKKVSQGYSIEYWTEVA